MEGKESRGCRKSSDGGLPPGCYGAPQGVDGIYAGAGTPEQVASPADAAQAPESKINQMVLAAWEILTYCFIVTHTHTHTHTHTLSLFAILLFWVFYTFNYLRINLISPRGKSLFCFLLISLPFTLYLTKLGETSRLMSNGGSGDRGGEC